MTIRLDPAVRKRLVELSKLTGIDMSTLAQLAIRAAMDAVDAADGKLTLPIQFSVETSSNYPNPTPGNRMELNAWRRKR
jgi:hypothetical protein